MDISFLRLELVKKNKKFNEITFTRYNEVEQSTVT